MRPFLLSIIGVSQSLRFVDISSYLFDLESESASFL